MKIPGIRIGYISSFQYIYPTEFLTKQKTMRISTLIPLLILAVFMALSIEAPAQIPQTVQDNSIDYVPVTATTGYLLDSTWYNDGTVVVRQTPVMDSTAISQKIVQDSIEATTRWTRSERRYEQRVKDMEKIQALKTPDSLKKVYYLDRKLELRAALQEIAGG